MHCEESPYESGVATDEVILSAEDGRLEEFLRKTREALGAADAETFLRILTHRESIEICPIHVAGTLSAENVSRLIAIEKAILGRLERERQETWRDLEKVTREISVARAYTSKFPLTSTPAFFDQTG